MTQEEMMTYIKENKVPCPKCGKSNFTDIDNLILCLKHIEELLRMIRVLYI